MKKINPGGTFSVEIEKKDYSGSFPIGEVHIKNNVLYISGEPSEMDQEKLSWDTIFFRIQLNDRILHDTQDKYNCETKIKILPEEYETGIYLGGGGEPLAISTISIGRIFNPGKVSRASVRTIFRVDSSDLECPMNAGRLLFSADVNADVFGRDMSLLRI